MPNSLPTATPLLVIDANVAVWAVLPKIAVVSTVGRLAQWSQQQQPIIVPNFWVAETTSVVRQLIYSKAISVEQGQTALNDLFALEVEIIPLTLELCHRALVWATHFQQSKVYDSLYVALAEQRQAELWTGDKRLVNRARQLKLEWVHWVGESDTQNT